MTSCGTVTRRPDTSSSTRVAAVLITGYQAPWRKVTSSSCFTANHTLAQAVAPATVARAAEVTNQAFSELKIRETKSEGQHGDNGGEKREIDGSAADRDSDVTITSEGKTTRVHVVAKKSAVTWDKDFARTVLDKIVAYSR